MKRREFVTTVLAAGAATPAMAASRTHSDHGPLDGPLANATVSFGAWPANPDAPFDRMTQPPPPPPPPNAHVVLPYVTTIKEGGAVNFVLAGLHQVQVFGPGTKPEDVSAAIVAAGDEGTVSIGPGLPPIINVTLEGKRVYRGVVTPTIPDRVDVVHFPKRGRYLVICGVLPHFNDGMYGWVRVIR
jgi:hypothetical protein